MSVATATASATAAASASAPVASASASVAEKPDTPPTERKAERKAAAEINKGNYKSELGKLEKDLPAP
jgi:hypothetical protein